MNKSNAQGHKAEGVSFCVVEIGNALLSTHLAKEIKDKDNDVERRKNVPKHDWAWRYWPYDNGSRNQGTQNQTDDLDHLLGIVESLEIDEEQKRRTIFVHKQKACGKYQVQNGKEIELNHS